MGSRTITVSRQCGSGGHLVGGLVARRLGIPFYDRELVKAVARRSGFSEEIMESKGEYSTPSLLFNIVERGFSPINGDNREMMPLSDQINAFQREVICDLAEKEPCVIEGRCSDFILRGRPDCLHVFIYGSLEDRIARVIRTHEVGGAEAREHVVSCDKKRAKYYKYETNRVWGQAENYNLCLDISWLGIDKCVDIVAAAYESGHVL